MTLCKLSKMPFQALKLAATSTVDFVCWSFEFQDGKKAMAKQQEELGKAARKEALQQKLNEKNM